MITINKKKILPIYELEDLFSKIEFSMPYDAFDFFKNYNGAEITLNDEYISLWSMSDWFLLNEKYLVNEFAPNFFLIGTNGGGTAFAIEKKTGHIFEVPFIGMSNDEAIFRCKTFKEFLKN